MSRSWENLIFAQANDERNCGKSIEPSSAGSALFTDTSNLGIYIHFIHQLVEKLKDKYPINARRVYLFGHSAGAGQALYLSLLESEYFAAAAVHAGAIGPEASPYMERAPRKIPIAIFVGTDDRLFPLPIVRATRDALNARGFKSELTEIKGHTQWYYDRAQRLTGARGSS